MKHVWILTFLLASLYCLVSQEMTYRVVEVKGKVDIKGRGGTFRKTEIGDYLLDGEEILTGFHSLISVQIGPASYITVNQDSHVSLNKIRIKQKEINSEIYIERGYAVILSREKEGIQNKIMINFPEGNVIFKESGGEIFTRRNDGVIIRCFQGRIDVNSRIKNRYFIRKGEMCKITKHGKLLESDYFLKMNINSIPYEYLTDEQKAAYYERLLNYYSDDSDITDYGAGFGNDDPDINTRP